MAMHIPKAPGFMNMVKDGTRYFQGTEATLLNNIEACKAIGKMLRSTYGPMGAKKMVINHIDKKFMTKDANAILRELEVSHPTAKLMVMACQQQEQEAGEGTNFVLLLCAALLERAERLITMGLSVSDVAAGFELAAAETLNNALASCVTGQVANIRDYAEVNRVIRAALKSKIYDYEEFLGNLITKACINIVDSKDNFNVDNIRVVKILGGGIESSELVNGMVFQRDFQGDVREASEAKVAVYSVPFDALQTETKGTVLLHSADELTEFSRGEESEMESRIRAIADTGCKIVVTGGKVGDLALHYANRWGLMIVRLVSKFDVRRLCRITGATPLPKFVCPSQAELGYVKRVHSREFGKETVVIFEQPESADSDLGCINTFVVRGSMPSLMDEVERAIDDAVNSYKVLTRERRLLAGGGCTELRLAEHLERWASSVSSVVANAGLAQYAMHEFATAFHDIVTTLIENTGENATELLAELIALHSQGKTSHGVVYGGVQQSTRLEDAPQNGIVDLYAVRYWGIKFACDAALTILRVNQMLMAREAGGPKAREPGPMDQDDD